MMKLVLDYYDLNLKALERGASINKLVSLPVREQIGRIKYIKEDRVKREYDNIYLQLQKQIDSIESEEE